MNRYFVSFYCMGSFGNSFIDVPSVVQTHEHILAIQKIIADRLNLDSKEICIVNFIRILPE